MHKVAQALAVLHCVELGELTSQLLEVGLGLTADGGTHCRLTVSEACPTACPPTQEWLLPPNMQQQDLNTTLVSLRTAVSVLE